MRAQNIIALAILLSTLALFTIGTGCEQESTGSAIFDREPQTYTVEIIDYEFSPDTIAIHKGDTIQWINKGSSMHDVRSNEGRFYSIPLGTGETYSFTFHEAGIFKYRCGMHPTMEGTIIVE